MSLNIDIRWSLMATLDYIINTQHKEVDRLVVCKTRKVVKHVDGNITVSQKWGSERMHFATPSRLFLPCYASTTSILYHPGLFPERRIFHDEYTILNTLIGAINPGRLICISHITNISLELWCFPLYQQSDDEPK